LNIFTCADCGYEDFIPLFVLSTLLSNPYSAVEIGVEDVDLFMQRHGTAMRQVSEAFPAEKLLIRSALFRDKKDRRILPNSVRFLTAPLRPSRYVYISDVDIIVLAPDLLRKHLRHMRRTGLPFSNMIRHGTQRMTGLHFTRYDALYPLPNCDDLDVTTMNDENLLYEIVRRRVGTVTIPGAPYRPVHGIHISPNRKPLGDDRFPGWGIASYKGAWRALRVHDLFCRTEGAMSVRVRQAIAAIDDTVSEMPD
jgi:hypothetical protein